MKRRYYTKIRNLLSGSREMYVQAYDNHVYLAEGHLIVCMPDWMYDEQFVQPDAENFTCVFPIVFDGDKLTRKEGEWTEDGCDLAKWFHDWFWDYDRNYKPVKTIVKGKHEGRSVRFCDSGSPLPVILNNTYYEAAEQSTRGGLMYADSKIRPVYFFDSPELHMSAFGMCVLPINYNPDTIKIPT